MIEFHLLQPISSVENFLLENFHVSKNTLKYFFDKKFLKRGFPARTVLQLPLNFVNDLEIYPLYEGPEIKIIYEDEIFLVLNKPSNIHSHPLTYNEKNNCLSFLREHYPHVLKANAKKYDRGLLYRLDFETSGVLVYVKDENAYFELRNNFKDCVKIKKYLCYVHGECKLQGSYKHFFKATEEKGKKIKVNIAKLDESYKEGELFLTPLEFNEKTNTSLMSVLLDHGLRHQIRAQLSFLGHPIVGDTLYGGQKSNRLFLHAELYKLTYKGKEFEFNCLPLDYQISF